MTDKQRGVARKCKREETGNTSGGNLENEENVEEADKIAR